MTAFSVVRALRLIALLGALGGCAQLPPPAPPAEPRPEPPPMVAPVLDGAPLTITQAGELALAQHPATRGAHAAWQAQQRALALNLRPANPSLGLARVRSRVDADEAWETEWGLHLPLGAWLSAWLQAPQRAAWGAHQQAAARAQWQQALDTQARSARRAWIEAVAARQLRREAELAWDAAETAAELARRLHAAGNWNRLNWLRWELAQAQQRRALALAQQADERAHERLAAALGLWQAQHLASLQLPEALPALPAEPGAVVEEGQALRDRLDLRAARAQAAASLQMAGYAGVEAWLASLDLGLKAARETEGAHIKRERGLELSWQLPLFRSAAAQRAVLDAQAELARWQLETQALAVRTQVRQAWRALQHAWDQARYAELQLQPLQAAISEELLLRWNGMLEGPFELLADAQARLALRRQGVEALRDYWLAAEAAAQVRWSAPGELAAPSVAAPAAPAAKDH